MPPELDVTFRWPAGPDHVVDVHLTGHVGATVHHPTRLSYVGRGVHEVTLRLPEDACVSYGFRVSMGAEHPEVPLPELTDTLVPDPANPDRIHGAFGSLGTTSVLELRGARRHPAWPSAAERSRPSPPAARPRVLAAGRRSVRWLPGGGACPVVVFDGDLWARDDFGFTRAWHAHTAHRAAARPGIVLVSTPDREILADRAAMRALLLDDVLPHLPGAPRRVAVAGQSYGALAAAGLLVDLPDLVAGGVLQSGSYWFGADDPDGDGTAGSSLGPVVADLRRRGAPVVQRVVVQAGSTEGAMLALSRSLARAAAHAGCATELDVFTGGHDYAWYRHGLLFGLDRLGLAGAPPPARRGAVTRRPRD